MKRGAQTKSTRLAFSRLTRAGQQFAHVRKFVATARYTGPTTSGFTMPADQLTQLITLLRGSVGSVPTAGQTQVGVVARSSTSEFHVGLVLDEGAALDIREHINTAKYVGYTKRGIRFPWNKLPEVLRQFEVLLTAVAVATRKEPTLFPQLQPSWSAGSQTESSPTSYLDELLGKLPNFPIDSLPEGSTLGPALTLPSETLELRIDRDGRWFVSALSGFHHAVKNEVEGKFILYARQRGHTDVALPTAMIHLAAYEKHCRNQFQRIVLILEFKSRNRQLAEFQTRQLFISHNLPLA
jgi:hypothetical protein